MPRGREGGAHEVVVKHARRAAVVVPMVRAVMVVAMRVALDLDVAAITKMRP